MASCFQHINECLYVVKSQLRSHWAYLAENGVRAADIERNPARAVVRIGKLLEEIDPAHREAFDRMTARKLRGELAEAA